MKIQNRKRHSSRIIPGDLGYFNTQLDYYKRMKKVLDAKQTQVDLITHRRKALLDSNLGSNQNEYSRILGVLERQNPGLNSETRQSLEQRIKSLKELGAKAIEGIN